MSNRNAIPPGKRTCTLCEGCANAVPSPYHGCPWSERGEPVTGWQAEETSLRMQRNINGKNLSFSVTGYTVRTCPLYAPDRSRRQQRELDRAGVERLSRAVVEMAAEDYRVALQHLRVRPKDREARGQRQALENFFRGSYGGALTHGMGPEILRRLREEAERRPRR